MAELSFVDSLLEQFDVALSQHQRLLRLQVPAAGDLLPHRLVGKEALGATFRYRLDCLSQHGDIELKSLMAQEATLSIMLPDGRYRDLHGLVEEAVMLGEDGGVYYYQLTLVPWFAMLKLGRDSRIFQNLNVIDIATQVFQGHAVSKGRFRFDTRRDYPERSYCVQYRESDFNFVSRLFEEEGLFYYFEHTAGQHTLVITDDVDTCSPVSPQQIRFHRQDATETEDTVTQWRGVRRLQPKRVTVGSFDYKQPPLDKRTTLDTQDDQGNLPETELYDYAGEYYYREFERGERLVDNRLEAHESRAKRFYGAGGIRHLSTGAWFELTQHSRHDTGGGEEREFLILGLSIHAENSLPMTAQLKPMPGSLQTEIQAAKAAHGLTQEDPENDTDEAQADAYRTGGTGHFLIDFEAQRRTHAFRNPLRHARPVVSGPQTAIIVGPEGEEVYSDHLNRVKAHFHWDRQGQRNDHDSCWLRVAQNNAGTQWGGVFTPRIGQEVLVDFLEGDVDRPLITGRIYNGEQTPEWHSNGLFSGFKSKTYRGGLFNELVLDDATDQERIKLNSEQKKTQLNLGYLIHQQGNFRGAFRGTGFDLRTDAYGSVRANKGLYLTSFGQPEAAGEQLELDPVKTQLDAAYELKNSLSNSATAHNAEALTAKDNLKTASDHTTPTYGRSGGGGDQTSAQGATDGGGKGQVKGLEAPWLHLASPAGITLSTPESLHFAQTHDFSATTGQDMNFSQGKHWVAAAREKLSLFVEKAGIKLFAGKQKVEIQAQSDNLELTSQQDNTTTSTESNIDLAAAEEVLLVSGGAYVRIKGGNIELHAPGKVEFFGAMKSFTGPTQQAYELPPLPDAENTQLKLHHTYGNDEPVALAQYQATFPDGSTRTGQLDNQGKATLDGVPPGCAFVDYHTQPDPINPDGSCFPKDKEGPPDISMLSQPSSSQPEEEEETLSTAEQLKQKAGQYNQRATDLREQLNNNPDGKSHEEALALQDQVTQLNADTQQLREDLNEAARAGELTGSDLTDALYDVDDAANRANNLRPEAARQVQYASPNGQQAREVAEYIVPGFGALTDAKDVVQLFSTGQYAAAAGMTGLAIASIFPLVRAARKVGRTSDAAEDVASASKQLGRSAARRVPGRVQSRINVSNEGWEHTLNRHFNSSRAQNKSQFTISEDELKGLLSSKEIIQSPARSLETGNYARTIEMDAPIGRLAQKWGGEKTNKLSIVTDLEGNLLTATPGDI